MHAQVIEIRLEPAQLEVVERLIRRELVPALREQWGFCGALHLTAQERSEALLVVLWETEDDAKPYVFSTDRAEPVSTSIPDMLALRAGSVTVWEVDARG